MKKNTIRTALITIVIVDVVRILSALRDIMLSDYQRSCDGSRRPVKIRLEHCARCSNDTAGVLAISGPVSVLLAPPGSQ